MNPRFNKKTYQLGRAFTGVALKEGTDNVARKHALQLVKLEQRLYIFWELGIQKRFLRHPLLITWVSWLYSFIHIPATIACLVWLYYYTVTRNCVEARWQAKLGGEARKISTCPELYAARRPRFLIVPFFGYCPRIMVPSLPRVACLIVKFIYPSTILVAIVAAANHFILDAVIGAVVCGLGWWSNSILLNLLPLED